MPNKESALLVHRENYKVPEGQEQVVHYKIAKMTSNGSFIEAPRIVKDEPKFFDSVIKRNLEALGYTVEILYHPAKKYTDVRIESKDAMLAAMKEKVAELEAKQGAEESEKEKALAAKDAEIEALKEQLAMAKEAAAQPKVEKKESKKGGK